VFLETNYAGPGLFDYHLQKNEYLAEDKDLCNAYDQLQKDCEDLKHLMEVFSKEIYVNKFKRLYSLTLEMSLSSSFINLPLFIHFIE
jgi:hypothetical protein